MAGGIQPIDFWGLFMASAAASSARARAARDERTADKERELREKQLQWEQDKEVKKTMDASDERAAVASYMSGRPAQLMMLNPMLAQDLDTKKLAQQKSQAELANARDAQRRAVEQDAALKRQRAAVMQKMIASAPVGPRRDAAMAAFNAAAARGEIDATGVTLPGGAAGPDDMERMGAESEAALALSPRQELESDLREFSQLYPQMQPGTPEFAAAFNKWKLDMRRAGATQVNMPGALTTATETKQQEEVVKARERYGKLERMEAAISSIGGYDKVADFGEQAKQKIGGVAKRLGFRGTDDEAMQARAAVEASIGDFTNPIISELSGANVPPSEFERIVKSLPHTSDPGPVLRAKVEAWKTNLKIIERNGVDYLVKGVIRGDIKLPGEKRKQAARAAGELTPAERDAYKALRKSGKSQAQAEAEIMRRRGGK